MMKNLCLLICLFVYVHQIQAQEEYKKYLALSYAELDSLMMIEYTKGAYDKAILYMQAGRKKASTQFGEMDSIYTEYTSNLGYFYQLVGLYEEAEPLYIQTQNIRAKTLGVEHPDYAISLNNLAQLYYYKGDYNKAIKFFIQTKNIIVKVSGVESPDYALAINNLAAIYDAVGEYDKAEPLLIEAKNIQAKEIGTEDPNFAISLNNLASLYESMGHYEKAEALYIQAKNIQAKVLGTEHPLYALSLNNLGLIYTSMDNFEKAEAFYTQAKDIRAKALGIEHPDYAQSLNNLAQLYTSMGDFEKAEQFYIQAKNIRAKALGIEHPDYAQSLNNLATLYEEMGNYEKSEELFIQSKNIQANSLGVEHPSFANCLNNLAKLYLDMKKLDSALYYCQQSIAANSSQIDTDFKSWSNLDQFKYYSNEHLNNSTNTLLSILRKQYEETNDISKMEQYYTITQSVLKLNEKIRNDFCEKGDKLRSLAKSNDLMLKGIQSGILLHKPFSESFEFAEANKGILLLDASKTTYAYQFGDLPDSLIIKEEAMQKKQSSLEANLLVKRPNSEKDSLLNLLTLTHQEINAFNKELKKSYPKYISLKYEQKIATSSEIQALLSDDSALLEYVIGDSVVYIFYMDKNKTVLIPRHMSIKELTLKIKEFHSTLSDYELVIKNKELAYKKYIENASWFYENLVAVALKDNATDPQIQKLIIVADGELGHLPFEAFLAKPAKQVGGQGPAPQGNKDYHQLHYLVNDYQISYNYSAALWKAQLHGNKAQLHGNKAQLDGNKSNKEVTKNTHNGQLLAMAANYNIKMDSTKMDWRLPMHQRLRDLLNPLPAARKEVETLAASFNGLFCFDSLASEKIFKEKASDYAIIHLAMHGLLDPKGPILSSLAFSEDGDSLENNFLQAYEISKMKLNADLVVLSACETGYGRFEKGNGIASLAQAFAYAGAPALIVSLWQVNDYATSEIMKNLYQNLADGMEKDAALQQAKLQYIKTAKGVLAHPAFWSPFILMGNTDAIYLEKKRGMGGWIIGGGILILSTLLLATQRQKKNKTS